MEAVDSLFELLSDGHWHTINEISTLERFRKVTFLTLSQLLDFLEEYEFIEGRRPPVCLLEAKMTDTFQEFWRRIRAIEMGVEEKSSRLGKV